MTQTMLECACEGTGWVDCWSCGGEGGYHDCGEDCCCCLDPDEPNETCDICHGKGGWPCRVCGE